MTIRATWAFNGQTKTIVLRHYHRKGWVQE